MALDNEIKPKLLELLEEESELTHREVNLNAGISLGEINYYISVLAEKVVSWSALKNTIKKRLYVSPYTNWACRTNELTIAFLNSKFGV